MFAATMSSSSRARVVGLDWIGRGDRENCVELLIGVDGLCGGFARCVVDDGRGVGDCGVVCVCARARERDD
jgi:hypothetical protein